MAIVTIGEMIKRVERFEEQLEQYYAFIRDGTRDNGVRLLTYYLSRHRRHMQEALKNFTPEEIEHFKKIKLKYDVEFHPEKEFHIMKIPLEQVRGKDLLEAAVEYDTQVVGFYRRILDQSMNPDAKEFVESLIRLEERDVVMLKKMIAMNYF